jgi:hypothetical protein
MKSTRDQIKHSNATDGKPPVRRGITISDCKSGAVKVGDKVTDHDGEKCWVIDCFDGIIEVDYRNENWSVKGQYYTVYLA